MKSRVLIAFGIALVVVVSATALSAQTTNDRAEWIPEIKHDTSPPLRDIALPPQMPTGFASEIPIRVLPGEREREGSGVAYPNVQRDERPVPGAAVTPSPMLNFVGQTDAENASVVGGRFVPPDTVGAVGANHFVQWVNLILSIYNKTTGARVMGPVAGNSIFAGFGGPCQSNNNGDPIVIYDQKNDRWVLSQFAINQGIQCVAVSATNDPTGSYHRYAFSIGGNNDYPKLALWLNDQLDLLTATYRTFGGPGGGFSLDMAAMNYAAMLNGNSAAQLIFRTGVNEGALPADIDGNNYPATAAPLFGRYNDNGTQFELWRIDGIGSGGATLNKLPSIAVGPVDRGLGLIQQPSPGEGLDDLAFFTMFRLVWRDYGTGFEQLLANTTADAGSDRAGVHWVELRNTGSGWAKFQEGLFAPGSLERWMGSIASDKSGDIVLGYTASNGSNNPSVRYTSRMPGDPLGQMPGGEVTAHTGGGVQTSSNNRWGDYSEMSIDPNDDCTFWYTSEYYANTGSFDFSTRILNFKLSNCGGPAVMPTITIRAGACGGTVTIVGRNFSPNNEVAILRSPNLNGFTKGGKLCNGAMFEVGEPITLPPVLDTTDSEGHFNASVSTSSDCNIEVLDFGSCQTSNAVDSSP